MFFIDYAQDVFSIFSFDRIYFLGGFVVMTSLDFVLIPGFRPDF